MESQKPNHIKLLEDILADAQKEATRLIIGAQQFVEERKRQFEEQIKQVKNESAEKLKNQLEALQKSFASVQAVELRKIALKAQESVFKKLNTLLEKEFLKLMESPEYVEVLTNWIIEAVIGLGTNKVYVNASAKEKELLKDSLLQKAAEKLKKLTNREVKLYLSQEPALLNQGVILTSEDGRLAFNNQVRTRIERKQGLIRKLVYTNLFAEQAKME